MQRLFKIQLTCISIKRSWNFVIRSWKSHGILLWLFRGNPILLSEHGRNSGTWDSNEGRQKWEQAFCGELISPVIQVMSFFPFSRGVYLVSPLECHYLCHITDIKIIVSTVCHHSHLILSKITSSHFIVWKGGCVLDLMDPIGPIGGPAFSSQTLIGGLWRRTTVWPQ